MDCKFKMIQNKTDHLSIRDGRKMLIELNKISSGKLKIKRHDKRIYIDHSDLSITAMRYTDLTKNWYSLVSFQHFGESNLFEVLSLMNKKTRGYLTFCKFDEDNEKHILYNMYYHHGKNNIKGENNGNNNKN